MTRRRGCTLLVMFTLFAQLHVVHPQEVPKCSRDKSRRVRAILDEYLLPYVESQPGEMSSQCPLKPEKDIYKLQESYKKEIRRSQWKCTKCDKVFRSEAYLDKHFENRHDEDLTEITADVCLAEYCDVVHCDHDHSMHEKVEHVHHCKQAVMDRRHHHCEAIAHKCFPPEGDPDVARLHEFFIRQFCDGHTCDSNRKYFQLGPQGNDANLGWWVLFWLVMVGMTIFYMVLYCWQSESPQRRSTLQRVTGKPGPKLQRQGYLALFAQFFNKSKKKKMY
ncbi:hypothetical protein CYMTET_19651 [Cymbomonas tetramitiformis]|uniref:C2H2-type domain-containing protein n=1 Tax=Cymbomonas tetramitiformis TaxID=36881 RepID=A0AAE0L4Z5_9CHLO|nr:hypothetical protein CYMTET_19651 [Cymbomonas tetramitiformis]